VAAEDSDMGNAVDREFEGEAAIQEDLAPIKKRRHLAFAPRPAADAFGLKRHSNFSVVVSYSAGARFKQLLKLLQI
jgi:hypothetical protein